MASRSLAKCSHDHHLLLQQSPKPHITVPVLANSKSTNSPFTLLLSVRTSVLCCRSLLLATILSADPVLSLLLSALSIN
jgi:hypothetical protein